MLPVFARALHRPALAGVLTSVVLLLVGCVDGPSPVDLPGGDQVATLAVVPHYAPIPQSGQAAPVNRIRIRARLASTGEAVGESVQDVDSGASSWEVTVEVRIPAGLPPQILLTLELISVAGGTETVQWSGEVGPITVTPGGETTLANVELGRGPKENLAVTGVTIQGTPSLVRSGRTAQLSATATTSEPGTVPLVFWSSLDPAVGTVSETGLFLGVSKGTARVVAAAGRAADTVSIPVAPALASVRVAPSSVRLESLGEETQLSATILDTEGNPVQGEEVTWSSLHPQLLQSLGGGRFRALANGTAQAVATSTAEPSLSSSATVVVRQVATTVAVTPDSVRLDALGKLASFSATARDARSNPVSDAAFQWVSTEPQVATVTQGGVATSVGGGRTEIQAWVLEPTGSSGATAERGPGDPTGVMDSAVLLVELPYTLEIAPPDTLLESLGESYRLFAYVRNQAGELVRTATVQWSSADPTTASVDPVTGIVTAVKDGTTSITGTLVAVGAPLPTPVTANASVTIRQRAVTLRWVVQPTDVDADVPFNPPPSVEAVDARGHRVTSFQGDVSIEEVLYSPAFAQPRGGAEGGSGQEPPQRIPSYTSKKAVDGLATFDGLAMVQIYDYNSFQLRALAPGLESAMSAVFWVDGYG